MEINTWLLYNMIRNIEISSIIASSTKYTNCYNCYKKAIVTNIWKYLIFLIFCKLPYKLPKQAILYSNAMQLYMQRNIV